MSRYRRLSLLKALGPITVCVISIATMNIFGWKNKPASIKTVGYIPKGDPSDVIVIQGWGLTKARLDY